VKLQNLTVYISDNYVLKE